jgi:hypothetical protein
MPTVLSFQCDDREAFRSFARYLRHLASGLEQLGPEPLRLAVHVVAPDAVPPIPPGASLLAPRHRYAVGRLGAELIYAVAGLACVSVTPGTGRAEIWTTVLDPDSVAELVSIAVLEIASFRGFYGLHAGAVVRDGVGYLLPGASGSGKTSVCLALTRAGFGYLTDDFLLLRAGADGLRGVPCFRTFKVDASWAARFAELSFLNDLPPSDGKRLFDPEACYPGSHVSSIQPAVIVFPTIVTDQDSTVREVSRRDAFSRLLPQIRLSADRRAAAAHLSLLGALVRDCVAFELRHGGDFLRAPVATVRRLFDALAARPTACGTR